ncbi:cytochrome b/b6 domain-containing protein [Accumulibacter sp.]|uniref:cytochrome b/b6 domain-containing protein n=1 Tax=Accumulibacter sp. TaxID=2053492 RepID=UPI00341D32FA
MGKGKLVQRDRELADLLQRLHFVLNLCLAALVVVHVAAVLKHRLLDRDEVFGRMLPFRAGKR